MPDFYEIWHSEQIEHANLLIYELELMIINQNYKFAKFVPKMEILSNLHEIWHSQQIKDANYQYNTRECLECLRDGWLRMTTGCQT